MVGEVDQEEAWIGSRGDMIGVTTYVTDSRNPFNERTGDVIADVLFFGTLSVFALALLTGLLMMVSL